MRKLDRLKLQRDIAIAEKARIHAEYVLKMDDLNRAIEDMQNDIDNLEAYGDMAVVEVDTPQTESTGSPIGDYRDGVGAWHTDCETCKHYKLACELFSEVCKYEPTTQTETQNSNLTFDTPQTEEPQKDCKKCKNYDRCKNNRWKCCVYEPKEEPQTDCGWK